MVSIGYALSSEEHEPTDLIKYAVEAERSGFEFALISDHYHPWISTQGNSPFVWSVLGAIAEATDIIRIGTGVTCPIIRIHPAIIAQASATTAVMMPDRFFLGVGTGENLNEHILGDQWPPFAVRLKMVEEAITVIRDLWTGREVNFSGDYFVVQSARLFTQPDSPPPVHVAASGEMMAEKAGELGSGIISTAPDEALIDSFTNASSGESPRFGQLAVCYAETEESAQKKAFEWWPNTALPGQLSQELRTPQLFEAACELVQPSDVEEHVVCGPDLQKHINGIQEFIDSGFDHVYIHQIGPNQGEFFDAYEKEIIPSFD